MSTLLLRCQQEHILEVLFPLQLYYNYIKSTKKNKIWKSFYIIVKLYHEYQKNP